MSFYLIIKNLSSFNSSRLYLESKTVVYSYNIYFENGTFWNQLKWLTNRQKSIGVLKWLSCVKQWLFPLISTTKNNRMAATMTVDFNLRRTTQLKWSGNETLTRPANKRRGLFLYLGKSIGVLKEICNVSLSQDGEKY